jgi:hypothetical protein
MRVEARLRASDDRPLEDCARLGSRDTGISRRRDKQGGCDDEPSDSHRANLARLRIVR